MSSYSRRVLKNPTGNIIINDDENPHQIRIAQWNIFAQGFVGADSFQYCSPADLSLDKRRSLFAKEFGEIQADIYCLQEADIHEHLLTILNADTDRYELIFARKNSSPCLLYSDNSGPDGCAVAFRKTKLKCLHQYILNLEDTGTYVSLFIVFCFNNDTTNKFIVVCTHLKSKKSFEDVRVNQGKMLLSKLQSLMTEWDTNSAFICGDFNASPNENVIKLMQDSPLNLVNVYDELKDSDQSESNSHYTTWNFRKDHGSTKRVLSERPVYKNLKASHREYEDTIDYIWYTNSKSDSTADIGSNLRNSIIPISIIEVPDKEEIGAQGIPSANKYPSDHISLIADFIIEKVDCIS